MSSQTLPAHLAQHDAQGLKAGELVAQFEIGNLKNFVYLILDWSLRQAALIDPQKDLSEPLRALKENGFELTRILLTHTHFDHIAGVPELVKLYPNLPLTLHELDRHRLSKTTQAQARFHFVNDGEVFQVGKISVQALHTPGHSAGEACYWIPGQPPYLLTGDTLFIRDCGRTDLETGSVEQMFESLQKIRHLPPETVILPGHHYARECASTLAAELKQSPPFRCKNVSELERLP